MVKAALPIASPKKDSARCFALLRIIAVISTAVSCSIWPLK
jgi:hypothetical protein